MKPEWLTRMGYSIEHGHKLELVAESERFALVKFPGHTYWSGIGCPRKYAQTSYYIVKKGTGITAFKIEVCKGRISKSLINSTAQRMKDMDKSEP